MPPPSTNRVGLPDIGNPFPMLSSTIPLPCFNLLSMTSGTTFLLSANAIGSTDFEKNGTESINPPLSGPIISSGKLEESSQNAVVYRVVFESPLLVLFHITKSGGEKL